MDSKSVRERIEELKAGLASKRQDSGVLLSARRDAHGLLSDRSERNTFLTPLRQPSVKNGHLSFTSPRGMTPLSAAAAHRTPESALSPPKPRPVTASGSIPRGGQGLAAGGTKHATLNSSRLNPPGLGSVKSGSKGVQRLEPRHRDKRDTVGRVGDLWEDIPKIEERNTTFWDKAEQETKAEQAHMMEGIVERERLERQNTEDVGALREQLSRLLAEISAPREAAFRAATEAIERRITDLRATLLEGARKDAATRRLVPKGPLDGGGGSDDDDDEGAAGARLLRGASDHRVREAFEQYEAAADMSRCARLMGVRAGLNRVHEALLREKTAREDDEVRVNAALERMVGEHQQRLSFEREARLQTEREVLGLVQATFQGYLDGTRKKRAGREGSPSFRSGRRSGNASPSKHSQRGGGKKG